MDVKKLNRLFVRDHKWINAMVILIDGFFLCRFKNENTDTICLVNGKSNKVYTGERLLDLYINQQYIYI